MIKVVKFGGSSLASAEQFKKVGNIIREEESRKYVVPSAPGKRFSEDTKVTDMLYKCYAEAEEGKNFDKQLKAIKERYNEIIKGLGLKLSLEEQFETIKKNFEAKAGKDGSWQDVTGSGSITITGNQTVYVRVTDGDGKVYEQNRSIKCYDTEKPTLSASLTDGVLTIQGNDTVSGITAVTVNGTTYTDLKDGMLRVQLTQKDFTTKQIEITVTDGAGNTSEKYVLQNPYYEWAKKQAEKQKTSSDSNGAMATTTSADATGTEKTTTSPLPQDAQASEPTDAKGTVDDRTVTGIEEQLNKEGETADSVTKTATEGTKEFYTISTKSGKIFYLIIDNSKSQDNVYFLTEVSEKDLMNFTLSDSVTLPEVDTVYAEPEKQAEEEKPETTETAEKDKVEDEIQMPEDKSPFGTYLLIALVAVGAAAGGYYFKVYKPKHEYDDEDEMEEDEDESEDSESEKWEVDDADEQEESIEPEILRDEDFDDAVLEDEEEEQE